MPNEATNKSSESPSFNSFDVLAALSATWKKKYYKLLYKKKKKKTRNDEKQT